MSQLPAKCILASSTRQHGAVSTRQLSNRKECTWEVVEVGCAAESRNVVRKGRIERSRRWTVTYKHRAMQPTLEVVVEMGMPAGTH